MSIELIGHTTYLLIALSYVVRDIVWLRALAIPASLCSIVYCYFRSDEPAWLIINWNVAFLVVNVYQLAAIFIGQVGARKAPECARFVDFLADVLKPCDAIRLFRAGQLLNSGPECHCLLKSGERHEYLYFLQSGQAEIYLHGKHVGQCPAGTFLGEIGYLSGRKSTASVWVSADATLIRWRHTALTQLLSRWPALRADLHQHLSEQIRARLELRESQLNRPGCLPVLA